MLTLIGVKYCTYLHVAELEKKLYDLKKFIKTLHETVPRADKPEEDQLASTEVPEWLSKDLVIKKRKLTLASLTRHGVSVRNAYSFSNFHILCCV